MKQILSNDPEFSSASGVASIIELFKSLMPGAVKDGRIDFETLRQLLGDDIDSESEHFGLNWHGKRRARHTALTPSTGTLCPCPEDGIDWDTTQNLMIEGDNLEVLKLLQKSYAGKVNMIYIDPPYNTGKDFVYPDNYKDNIQNYLQITGQVDKAGRKTVSNHESSGRFHTDWLNMIFPRLHVARNLLGEDGIIFISIDQVELANLKVVCDEVFGEENFFAILTRRAMHTVRNSSKDFNLHADYILVYARSKAWFGANKDRYIRQIADKSGSYTLDDNDGRGPYKLDPLSARNYYTPYTHTFQNGVVWEAPEGSYPRYAQKTLEDMEADNRIVFSPAGPRAKRYFKEVQQGQPPNTILSPDDVGFNLDGTKDLSGLLDSDKVFSQPKPVKLIRFLMTLMRNPGALVMDFFAGSGTTAHAVMEQNAEDGGTRRFIVVQLPEPLDQNNTDQKTAADYCAKISRPQTIAELTKQRIRNASARIKKEYPLFKGDLGFRVFKLQSSNIRTWEPEPENIQQSLLDSVTHIKEGRTDQDILYELILRLGLDLAVPISEKTIAGKSVFNIGHGALMACLDRKITRNHMEPLAQGIIQWHSELSAAKDTIVIFRDSAFADDVAKTNITAILQQSGFKNVRSI